MSISLTAHIVGLGLTDQMNAAFAKGYELGRHHKRVSDVELSAAWDQAFEVQRANGMVGGSRRLLTAPGSNHKLSLATRPSWGLTLHHHHFRTTLADEQGRRLVVNACPSAGDCTRLCVLNNNWGRRTNVKLGWAWRTDLLARDPVAFSLVFGHELGRVLRATPSIMFRPNVNSDIEWEVVLPALVDGSVLGDAVDHYGYTKHTYVLNGDGDITPHYRLAYSWNEKSTIEQQRVIGFVQRGGCVAVVTDRYYGAVKRGGIRQWCEWAPVVDADVSDEWILQRGVVGDLAFKPDNNELLDWARTSDFVVKLYHGADQEVPLCTSSPS
jgi:hypothetical protein